MPDDGSPSIDERPGAQADLEGKPADCRRVGYRGGDEVGKDEHGGWQGNGDGLLGTDYAEQRAREGSENEDGAADLAHCCQTCLPSVRQVVRLVRWSGAHAGTSRQAV
jgi:hypothetical protein